jgi:hypothetical protein
MITSHHYTTDHGKSCTCGHQATLSLVKISGKGGSAIHTQSGFRAGPAVLSALITTTHFEGPRKGQGSLAYPLWHWHPGLGFNPCSHSHSPSWPGEAADHAAEATWQRKDQNSGGTLQSHHHHLGEAGAMQSDPHTFHLGSQQLL